MLFYRYINSLDPKISGQPWTYEEDKRLLQLVQKYGTGAVYRTFFSLLFLVCCMLVSCGFHNHVYFGGCVIAVGSLRVANMSRLVGNSLSPCSNGVCWLSEKGGLLLHYNLWLLEVGNNWGWGGGGYQKEVVCIRVDGLLVGRWGW